MKVLEKRITTVSRTVVCLLLLVWVLAACGDDNNGELPTGATESFAVGVSSPKSLVLDAPAGEIVTQGGGGAGISGTIEYNVGVLKPVTEGGNTPEVKIKQDTGGKKLPGSGLVNKWNLKLGSGNPYDLNLNMGNGNAAISTGETQLSKIGIKISKGNFTLNMDQPQNNLGLLNIEVGEGNITLNGLSNAGTPTFSAKGGSGQIFLDFSGGIKAPYSVSAGVGTGDITFIVPAGLGVKLNATIVSGAFSAPGFTRQGNQTIYTNAEFAKGGNVLTLNLQVSNGSIKTTVK